MRLVRLPNPWIERYLERTLPDFPAAEVENMGRAVERVVGRFASDSARAWSLNTAGGGHREKGQYADALRCHERALEIRRALGDRRGEAVELAHIGQTHWYADRLEEALRHLELSLTRFREAGDRASEATVLWNTGRCHEDTGNLDEALKCLQRSLSIFRELEDHEQAATTLDDIQRVQDKAPDLD